MLINSPNLNCRMYEPRYPEPNTPVMVHVDSINADGYGPLASLLEYNNIEALICMNDLPLRRVRRLVTVGSIKPRMVLRVDKEKGYIDLSKVKLSQEEAQRCRERYENSKVVHTVLCHLAEVIMIDLEDLYILVGWPLYRKYGHAFEAFKLIVNDPESILDPLTRDVTEVGPDGKETTKVVPALTEEAKDVLVKIIRIVMIPQPLKVPADIELDCFQLDGVPHMEAKKRNNLSAQTAALPKRKVERLCAAPRRSLRLQNKLALCRIGEHNEFYAAHQVPNLGGSRDEKKMEEKIDFLVEAMQEVKSKVCGELPQGNRTYKSLYNQSQMKIEKLEKEKAKLCEKLDAAHGLLEEFNSARANCSGAMSKLRKTIDRS